MSGITINLNQGTWAYVDFYLQSSSGVGQAGVLPSACYLHLKRFGDVVFERKLFEATQTTSLYDAPAAATSIILTDSSIFPPENFYIILDPSGAGNGPEVAKVLTNNTTLNTLILDSGLTNSHVGTTVVRLIDFIENANPPVGSAPVSAPDGYYSFLLSPNDLSVVGPLLLVVTDNSSHPHPIALTEKIVHVKIREIENSELAAPVPTCILTGHIVRLDGTPLENVSVQARLLAVPVGAAGSLITDQTAVAYTDMNGFFAIMVPQSATVDVTIRETGYRRVFVVPATTEAKLLEIA